MHITRVHIAPNPQWGGLEIHMLSEQVGGLYAVDFKPVVYTKVKENERHDALPLNMNEASLRVMYEEMRKFFGDSYDLRTLRQDYLAERARVDKFIDKAVRSR